MMANESMKKCQIIAVAQQKGGSGKTTLALQLLMALKFKGYKTLILDIDPQASATAWFEQRKKIFQEESPLVLSLSGWKLTNEIDRLKSSYDFIILDTPPHAEMDSKVAIRAATLLLLPVQPSPLDLWAMTPTLELAKKERIQTLIVLNRAPPRGKLSDKIKENLTSQAYRLLSSVIGNRTLFASTLLEGYSVVEKSPKSQASLEILTLTDELLTILSEKT